MSVHFSNLYGIFKNSSYHVSKEKTSAQRQKRKKPLLGRPIFTLNLYLLVAVLIFRAAVSLRLHKPMMNFLEILFSSYPISLWFNRSLIVKIKKHSNQFTMSVLFCVMLFYIIFLPLYFHLSEFVNTGGTI